MFTLIEPEYAVVLETIQVQENTAYGAPKRQHPTSNEEVQTATAISKQGTKPCYVCENISKL